MRQSELESALVPRSFRTFGRSAFWPFRTRRQSLAVSDDFTDFRGTLRARCPAHSGVYGMVDAYGQLVYVGMSVALRKRLVTYFQGGDAPRKERCVAAHARRLVWEVVGHPLVAELRELELIRRHQPRLNVRGRQRIRPPGYIYISSEPAPRLRIARRLPKAARHAWGPLAITWRVRDAVELLNRQFKLCDCPPAVPMHFADQRSLFSFELRAECLRGETGTCLGPCAGLCTRAQYSAQLRQARAFLDGRDMSLLERLEQQLADAARLQQYERAARLRDTLDRLDSLCERLSILREPPLPKAFVYPARIRRRDVWCFFSHGRLAGAAYAPTDSRSAQHAIGRLDLAFPDPPAPPRDADRPGALIVASWFRKHASDVRSILRPQEARRICIAHAV